VSQDLSLGRDDKVCLRRDAGAVYQKRAVPEIPDEAMPPRCRIQDPRYKDERWKIPVVLSGASSTNEVS
jgi:hypothetical protein